jgi:perosamine synthetase
MTNLQAALGVAQLERIDEFAARKRAMGKRYTQLLSGIPGLQLPVARTDYAENIYWVYGLVLSDEVAFDAAVAMKKLAALGIGCRPFFCPMNQQPVLLERGLFNGESHPVAERMYRKGFYIPSGLALTDAQMTRVAEALGSILK